MDNTDSEREKKFEKQQNVESSSRQQVTSTAQNTQSDQPSPVTPPNNQFNQPSPVTTPNNQSNQPSPVTPPNNSAPAGLLTSTSQAFTLRAIPTAIPSFVNTRVPPPAIRPNISQLLGLIDTRMPPNIRKLLWGGFIEIDTSVPPAAILPFLPLRMPQRPFVDVSVPPPSVNFPLQHFSSVGAVENRRETISGGNRDGLRDNRVNDCYNENERNGAYSSNRKHLREQENLRDSRSRRADRRDDSRRRSRDGSRDRKRPQQNSISKNRDRLKKVTKENRDKILSGESSRSRIRGRSHDRHSSQQNSKSKNRDEFKKFEKEKPDKSLSSDRSRNPDWSQDRKRAKKNSKSKNRDRVKKVEKEKRDKSSSSDRSRK